MKKNLKRKCLFALLSLGLLVFFYRLGEAELKIDGMTYSAVAKHVVSLHDWLNFHYTPSAYWEYYIHPPLLIWLQAAVFEVLPPTDVTARLVPGFFGLGTLLLVFFWGELAHSIGVGLLSALVLLTSYPYVKYASDAYNEGLLLFWQTLGFVCFLLMERGWRRFLAGFGFALALAGAFMSKGLVALSLPLATFFYAVLTTREKRFRPLTGWILSLAGAFLILSPWLFFGKGISFIQNYLAQSVSGRTQAADLAGHLEAGRVFLRRYWPWLPFLVFGIWRWARDAGFPGVLRGPLGLALIQMVVVLLAFSFTGHIHEHYLLPLYPGAALLVAWPFHRFAAARTEGLATGCLAVTFAAALFIAIYPYPLRAKRDVRTRLAARCALARCDVRRTTEVLISRKLDAWKWMALAAVLWETPWNATYLETARPAPPTNPGQILLASRDEFLPEGWLPVDCSDEKAAFVVFEPAESGLCK